MEGEKEFCYRMSDSSMLETRQVGHARIYLFGFAGLGREKFEPKTSRQQERSYCARDAFLIKARFC